MLRIYDFHIEFQFWTDLALPRDFQMALTHRWLSPDLGVSRMDPETQWMVFRDLYRYPHMYLSALLIHRHFCTFWAHPIQQGCDRLRADLQTPFAFAPLASAYYSCPLF